MYIRYGPILGRQSPLNVKNKKVGNWLLGALGHPRPTDNAHVHQYSAELGNLSQPVTSPAELFCAPEPIQTKATSRFFPLRFPLRLPPPRANLKPSQADCFLCAFPFRVDRAPSAAPGLPVQISENRIFLTVGSNWVRFFASRSALPMGSFLQIFNPISPRLGSKRKISDWDPSVDGGAELGPRHGSRSGAKSVIFPWRAKLGLFFRQSSGLWPQ